MPPKKSTEGAAGSGNIPALTPNEYAFIGSMLRHMTSKPEVDWDSVSKELGLKDAKCTKERYRQMGIKHQWNGAKKSSSPATPTKAPANKVAKPRSTKKTPAKKKQEPDPESEVDELNLGEASGVKKEVIKDETKEEDSDSI